MQTRGYAELEFRRPNGTSPNVEVQYFGYGGLLLRPLFSGYAWLNGRVRSLGVASREGQQVTSSDRLFALRRAHLFPAVIAAALAAGLAEAGQYEQPPSFTASKVMPSSLLHSPNYRIENHVGLDNFQYVFRVETQWGTFVVKGTDLLRVRAKEIAATKKLEEINGAETAVTAAGRTALRPLGTAEGLLTQPGKTISDTFKGVSNMVGSAGAAMHATDPHRDSIIASVTGGAEARRKLAFDLSVDPYTSFPPLDGQLKRLATASAVGDTGANVGLGFVTGPAGIAIGATGTAEQLREALRDKTAAQLEQKGREFLTAMGISKPTQDAFYANPYLTPTDKAVVVVALKTLGNARGREIFLTSAATANSTEMGFFYRRQAVLIGEFNKKVTPVRGFVRKGGAPMLETGRGTVSILPVDYLYWSPPLKGLAADAKGGGEMWITGRASRLATSQLASLGWKVVPKVGERLD
jgi:hypothetical protein